MKTINNGNSSTIVKTQLALDLNQKIDFLIAFYGESVTTVLYNSKEVKISYIDTVLEVKELTFSFNTIKGMKLENLIAIIEKVIL